MFCGLRRVLALGPIACALMTLGTPPVWADGAFPDSYKIYAPIDRPQVIILPTNFGLLTTSDGGANWEYVCEDAILLFSSGYAMGAPPNDLLYAYPQYRATGLVGSADLGCTWAPTMGGLMDKQFTDLFADPTDPLRVLGIAHSSSVAIDAVFESKDGGKTFPTQIYRSDVTTYVSGVEIAASNPKRVYVTLARQNPVVPIILTSTDSGQHFKASDQSAVLAPLAPSLSIAAVDPLDEKKCFFRAQGQMSDWLVLSEDGGKTTQVVLKLDSNIDSLSAFLRRADGTILVATQLGAGGYISTDGGHSFSQWKSAVHARGLAERDGRLYVAADNYLDGFAAGVSDDNGATWQGLVSFGQIRGIRHDCPSAQSICEKPWQGLISLFGLDAGEEDGGTSDGSEPADSGPGAGGHSGCSCSATESGGASMAGLVLVLLGHRARRFNRGRAGG